ncbi:unnamed protein product [Rhizoctonia solani]|uniref:O-methylsterigmatocystin oxidoreductase n=1 Tax=Rhizoctonia solani TaxID=456999 RepID=A0A8H2WQN1_9AGAM|nr:unnamed protein product [Rhizoctonia solani]CAE6485347.1 unnamed protein product [Rhizoctonia solani]
MTTSPVVAVLVPAALGALSFFVYKQQQRKYRSPLPPSPKADPIIAHLRCMPSEYEEVVYKAWGDELGSNIISLDLLGQVIIVLNSVEDANELLVKRAPRYSNRLQVPMLSSPRLTGWGNGTALLNYGDRLRRQRKITHEVLQKQTLKSIWPAMVKQTRMSMQRISNATDLEAEIARMVAVVLQSAYGYEAAEAGDPMVEIAKAGMRGFSDASMPADFLVNVFPWLEYIPSWFPGAEWKRNAMAWNKARDDLITIPFEWTKKQMATGIAQPSTLHSILTELASKGSDLDRVEEEDRVKWAIASLYAGAMDTTTASILVFLVAMIHNPDVQTNAQEELDAVLGDQRLPEMEDQDSLPYISRVIKEVLRWRPVVPLGVPHACAEDDTYKGYSIPKGAVVMGNAWAMCNNPAVYFNPESFNPDRFIDSAAPDPPAFGFGRRICPGQHFAEASLFLAIATILAIFDIQPAKDKQGNRIIPDSKLTGKSLIRLPPPFQCSIKPRSEAKAKLLFQN